MFLVMAITGMIFSPIGEKSLLREMVHSSFSKTLGDVKASIINSSTSALTHLSHLGLVFIGNGWFFHHSKLNNACPGWKTR